MTWVLVVDDEQRICRFVARALEGGGFQVDAAETGPKALHMIENHRYAVVILDLLMPGMDGYEVLTRIVAADPSQRVLVLSAVGDVEARVRCLRLGAVDYMSKPFAIAELIERVRHRADEPTAAAALRYLDVNGIRLDTQRRQLQVGERQIPLSQKEFVLLSHLMRHAGEVCTRDQLLADVWGYSFDPGSNVVDVCVGRLRAKLERELIETIRNVGYCFIAS
jgi:two-component system OmpR family response regulator